MYLSDHVAIMVRAISRSKVQFIGLPFIDDTDLISAGCFLCNQHSYESTQSIVQRAQAGAHTWQGALDTSGCALEPSKCVWGLINFIFINGKW